MNITACRIVASLLALAIHGNSFPSFGCRDALAAATPITRETTVMARLGQNGISEPVNFMVPADTRSVTVIVEGDPSRLYALASLRTADGVEHVGVDLSSAYGQAMEHSYDVDQLGQMPGGLFQVIRLGTFTHIYPYAPGQSLPDGASRLQVASNATSGEVKITILMPADDGGKTLHVNLISASDTFSLGEPPSFLPAVQAIFDQAGIRVVVDEVKALTGTGLNRITEWTEPQETPASQSAQLALRGQRLVMSDALNIYVVDSLPTGLDGLSLGTPGPPVPSSYYYGVVLPHIAHDATMARIFAHEVSHFLALQHLTNTSASGTRYPGPIPDAKLADDNLMENGTLITPGQAFALSRSALLKQH
jgi:hypothetical protein